MTSAPSVPGPARPRPVHAWVDAGRGVAGDMLLGALVDAGAALEVVQGAVEAVIPGTVRLTARTVRRAGMRATKVDVEKIAEDVPHRHWREIRSMIDAADLAPEVRERAQAVFARLAEAEARAHGIPAEEVHFHEVGAWDSIADVVGVAAALHGLGVGGLSAGPVALGSGTVRTSHGEIPVPVPAVLELAAGRRVLSGGAGELTTPTGMAVLAALAGSDEDLPDLRVTAVGVGAGTRDPGDHPNVVRVVLGVLTGDDDGSGSSYPAPTDAVVLEANVDDLDPRVWPGVLTALLDAGASDAWLTPVLMKKGRPAHTLAVLAEVGRAPALRAQVLDLVPTFGVRETTVRKTALERTWREVDLDGAAVRVKVAHVGGVLVTATPEFEDVAALAATRGVPVRHLLDRAGAAAASAGLVRGASVPD